MFAACMRSTYLQNWHDSQCVSAECEEDFSELYVCVWAGVWQNIHQLQVCGSLLHPLKDCYLRQEGYIFSLVCLFAGLQKKH